MEILDWTAPPQWNNKWTSGGCHIKLIKWYVSWFRLTPLVFLFFFFIRHHTKFFRIFPIQKCCENVQNRIHSTNKNKFEMFGKSKRHEKSYENLSKFWHFIYSKYERCLFTFVFVLSSTWARMKLKLMHLFVLVIFFLSDVY